MPFHARDTTERLICDFAKCRGREVEVSDRAPDTTVRYGDIYALALVCSGHLLATDRVLIRVGAVVSWVGVK